MDATAAGVTLITLGAVSIVAAIAGSLKSPAGEIPAVKSAPLRFLLGVVGAAFMFLGFGFVSPPQDSATHTPGATTRAEPGSAPGQPPDPSPAISSPAISSPATSSSVATNPEDSQEPDESPEVTEGIVDFVEQIDPICANYLPDLSTAYDSVDAPSGHLRSGDLLAGWANDVRSLAPPGVDKRLLDPMVQFLESMAIASYGMSSGFGYDSSAYDSSWEQYYTAYDNYRALVEQEQLPACQQF